MEKVKPGILYVDDEINNLNSFKANLRHDFNIILCDNPNNSFELIEANNALVVVSDQRMPVMTGIDMLCKIREKFPFVIRILLTGYTDYDVLVDAVNKGEIYRYLNKPVNFFDLKQTLFNAVDVYKLQEENRNLMERLKVANTQLEFMLREKLSHNKD